jgi:arsenate reductase
MFPPAIKTIHIAFEDPSGNEAEEYEKTLQLIEAELLPRVKAELC